MSGDQPPCEPTTTSAVTLADGSAELIAGQRGRWQATLTARPGMYGAQPSQPGRYATQRFSTEKLTRVLELGAGQGRDTLAFLRAGLSVHAIDYAPSGLAQIAADAAPELSQQLASTVHDVREPLPFADQSFDACYAHMLFTMALSSDELAALAAEVHRVLRPGGLCIYTARHTADSDYGTGRDLGDNLYENGGFIVHFFDEALVQRLAQGFELQDILAFEEGNLPRRLWQITMRRP